jgi:hypothetical protein
MSRQRGFWLAFFLLSLGAAYFSLRYFASAFPLVKLDLRMDRREALDSARRLAERWDWGPRDFQQAASFRLDAETQSFVELEAGGKEAFARLLVEGLYSPYTWQVRHFREGETRETRVRFTPAGEPYGFLERFPENAPGARLNGAAARELAESAARERWGVDFSLFELVEASQEIRPSERIDHTLVYQRTGARLGESPASPSAPARPRRSDAEAGRYRLRLVVTGDRLSELTHWVWIPEGFSRRYQEMRSANETLAAVAALVTGLVYLIGGVGVGLFFLLRARWVIWRTPLLAGVGVGFLQLLAGLNEWPLVWMDYDTAVARRDFVLQSLVSLLLQFVVMSLVFALSFAAAESLTRRAFPGHPQLWRVWSRNAARSWQVLGRTVAGYLLVSLFFAYEVALYFVTTRWLGWWTPSDALFHPDVLANYFPWFSAIAVSLQAGFWEECLFRAVPLAGAALLGERLGRRRSFLIAAFVLQAVVFGAGHANYPNQPAYARLVELLPPSFAFGGVYLFFGLFPAIVLHFTFDVVWFALPLFVADTPGIVLDRALVVLLTLTPLWVVVFARWRGGGLTEMDAQEKNQSWVPEEPKPVAAALGEEAPAARSWSALPRWAPVAGIAGLAMWAFLGEFQTPAPPLRLGRAEAVALAQTALEARGTKLEPPWVTLSYVQAVPDQEHRFVWQSAGAGAYRELLGSYLAPPQWVVRFARFEGDVAERAEEYLIFADRAEEVRSVRHRLPEARAGPTLTEPEARELAQATLRDAYALEPSGLKEVSAVPVQLPARRDWTFTFARPESRLSSGEARIVVSIAGDEVVDRYRHVHVPEDWERAERQRRILPRVVQTVCSLLLALALIAAVARALVAWSGGSFRPRVFLVFLLLLTVWSGLDFANAWPTIRAGFSTDQPLSHQILLRAAGAFFVALMTAAGLGLIAGFLHSRPGSRASLDSRAALSIGLSLGAWAAGMGAASAAWTTALTPPWPDYQPAGAAWPLLSAALRPLRGLVVATALMLVLASAAQRFSGYGARRKGAVGMGLLLAGLAVAGATPLSTLSSWLVSGFFFGATLWIAFHLIVRLDSSIVPLSVGVLSILAALKQGLYRAHPSALPGMVLSVFLMALISYVWFRKLRVPPGAAAISPRSVGEPP